MSDETVMKVCVSICVAAVVLLAAVAVHTAWRLSTDTPSCWKDSTGLSRPLDFDFISFESGRPVRCGYLPPKDIMPRIVGEEGRIGYSDVMCYPLERTPCSGAKQ